MNLKNFWNKYGFWVLIGFVLLVIIYFKFFHKDQKNDIENKAFLNFLYSKVGKKSPPKESKGERECKRIMESIFGVPFIKIRPKWMMNHETGKNLELDLYNPDLKIAVEYSGAQHYHFNSYFHRTEKDFQKQKERDILKRKKCTEYGILLIEVPYTVDVSKIEEFLKDELKKNGKI